MGSNPTSSPFLSIPLSVEPLQSSPLNSTIDVKGISKMVSSGVAWDEACLKNTETTKIIVSCWSRYSILGLEKLVELPFVEIPSLM